jgi:hypothetical protein
MGTGEGDVEFQISYHRVEDGQCALKAFSETKCVPSKQVAMLRFELAGTLSIKPPKMKLWIKIPEGDTRDYPIKKDDWGCITFDRSWTSMRLRDIGITQDLVVMVELSNGGKWEFDGTPAPADESTVLPLPDARPHYGGGGGGHNHGGGHHGGVSQWECGGNFRGGDDYYGHPHQGGHAAGGGYSGAHRQSEWMDNDDDLARAIAASLQDQPGQPGATAAEAPKPQKAVNQPQKVANQAPKPEEKLDFAQLYLSKEEAETVWAKLTCESEQEENFDTDEDTCGPLTHPPDDPEMEDD